MAASRSVLCVSRPPARPARATASVIAVVAVAIAVTGCSNPTPAEQQAALSGCVEGERGTIVLGVTNSAGDPLEIVDVELAASEGVEIIDRFIAPDEEARSTAVLFDDGGRDAFDGVDLDAEAIEPDAAAFVGIEVRRTGAGEGMVEGVTVVTEARTTTAPVTLELRDSCA